MTRSIGKQFVVIPKEEKEGYGGKDMQKRQVLSLERKSGGVMDDESGDFCCQYSIVTCSS